MTRIYHTWDKWECFPAGFFDTKPPKGMTEIECEEKYRDFLRDDDLFAKCIWRVFAEWPHSCEHNLTNESMNRIAWIGQAAMCIHTGVPARFRAGYHRLTEEQRYRADQTALKHLNIWREARQDNQLMLADAQSKTEANLY